MRIHYDDQIKIQRLKTVSGSKKQYVATFTAETNIQPLGKDRSVIAEGMFGSTYAAFVGDDTNVQVGDRVVDRNSVAYNVTQVIVRDYGAFPYKELILKRT